MLELRWSRDESSANGCASEPFWLVRSTAHASRLKGATIVPRPQSNPIE